MTESSPICHSKLKLFLDFLKIGIYSYGGPAIVIYQSNYYKQYIPEDELKKGLALTQMSPGPFGVNYASYIGYYICGLPGAIIAPIAFIIPTTIAVTALSIAYSKYSTSTFFEGIIQHFYPIVCSIILNASLMFMMPYLKELNLRFLVFTFLSFVLITLLKTNPVYIVMLSGIISQLLFKDEKVSVQQEKPKVDRKRITLGLIGFSVLFTLILILKHTQNLHRIGISFLKVSLLSFGGGFGAIPLIIYESTHVNKWVDMKTLMDGILIGTITPGPVISTSTFVGYMVSGFYGAIVASIFAYMSSLFLFNILTGLQEILINHSWYTKALKGIVYSFGGLLLFTLYKVVTNTNWDLKNTIIFIVASALIISKKISPFFLVIISIIILSLL